MSYAGDSPSKKIVRARIYDWAYDRMVHRQRSGLTVVALAGRDASDIGPIRAFRVADKPDDVLLIDVEDSGLRKAQELWPGVHTFHGMAHEAPLPWKADLVVMDLCGSVESSASQMMLRHLRKHIRIGTIIAVTMLNGRDKFSRGWREGKRIERRGGRLHADGLVTSAEFGRVLATSGILMTCLDLLRQDRDSAPALEISWWLQYRGHKSPMIVAVFEVKKAYEIRKSGGVCRDICGLSYAKYLTLPGRDRMSALLEYADHLALALGRDRAAQALNVTPRTLAAWRAHRTMGTYRSDDAPLPKSAIRP